MSDPDPDPDLEDQVFFSFLLLYLKKKLRMNSISSKLGRIRIQVVSLRSGVSFLMARK